MSPRIRHIFLSLALVASAALSPPADGSSFRSPDAVKAELRKSIRAAALRWRLDPRLVEAVVEAESGYAHLAVSPAGAMGLMQVMPATAEECGIQNAFHPLDNLMGACECLRKLINKYQGNLELALAAYNAGPGNVAKHGGVPPFTETRNYVRKVLDRYESLRKAETSRPG